ncbi:MAG: protein transporter tim9, partial [Tremellales sp. Tagirdzhanova-0007]
MDFSQFNGPEQAHMTKMIEKKQMQDFMRLYSSLVERCFNACAQDFTSKALSTNETTCVQNCTDKFLKHSERVGARFAEHNAGKKKCEEARRKKAAALVAFRPARSTQTLLRSDRVQAASDEPVAEPTGSSLAAPLNSAGSITSASGQQASSSESREADVLAVDDERADLNNAGEFQNAKNMRDKGKVKEPAGGDEGHGMRRDSDVESDGRTAPKNLCETVNQMIDFVYPAISASSADIADGVGSYRKRADLAPTNNDVDGLNEDLLGKLPGDSRTFFGTNTVKEQENAAGQTADPNAHQNLWAQDYLESIIIN